MSVRATVSGLKNKLLRSGRVTTPEIIILLKDFNRRITELEKNFEKQNKRITKD